MTDRFVEEYIELIRASDDILDCEPVPIDEITDGQDFLFISYSHKDYRDVYADLAVMARKGIRFWYDEGLSAGKNWNEEVQMILNHPNCIGVIFFISENMFLSKHVNQEIRMVCRENSGGRKAYFSVNLSQNSPKNILWTVMKNNDAVLQEAELDMEGVAALTTAFSDNQTYLMFSKKNHHEELIKEIHRQFPTVEGSSTQWEIPKFRREKGMCGYLEVKGSRGLIMLKNMQFKIGRDIRWADYCVNDPYVGRMNTIITIEFLDEGYVATDLGSSNGTYVNEMKLQPFTSTVLHEGDTILIGKDCEFIFHSGKQTMDSVSHMIDTSCFTKKSRVWDRKSAGKLAEHLRQKEEK